MALRKTYYDLNLKKDKLESITMTLGNVLDSLGCIYPSSNNIGDIIDILIQNYNLNSRLSSRYTPLHEDDSIVLGLALTIKPLLDAVDKAKLPIELCPRISLRYTNPGPSIRDYQLDLMIRYIDESDVNEFSDIINDLYTYLHVENDG